MVALSIASSIPKSVSPDTTVRSSFAASEELLAVLGAFESQFGHVHCVVTGAP